jgi:hypothetical protein
LFGFDAFAGASEGINVPLGEALVLQCLSIGREISPENLKLVFRPITSERVSHVLVLSDRSEQERGSVYFRL